MDDFKPEGEVDAQFFEGEEEGEAVEESDEERCVCVCVCVCVHVCDTKQCMSSTIYLK